MKIPLSKVTIGERQRAFNESHAQSLASSMADIGQIHNIGCRPMPDGNYQVVWGRHRVAAATVLQWTEIDAVVRNDLTPELEQELEYEEDARRLDRSWQEKCTAIAKLKRLKEKRTGDNWSLRKMADFTGFGKSSIGYMIQVAEALNTQPKDEEMWACDSYLSAIKLLMVRVHKSVSDELNRKRKDAEEAVLPGLETTGTDVTTATPVQLLDTTPEETTVYIHWRRKAFKDAVSNEDFFPGRAFCILGFEQSYTPNIETALDPRGYCVLWDEQPSTYDGMSCAPWQLIWNTLSQIAQKGWPFAETYVLGTLFGREQPLIESCRSSVITAAHDEFEHLPSAVVEYSIDAVCPPNMPVLCIGGVRPVHVAQTGHTPIFFVENEVLAAKYIEELKAFYEETVPGVKVVVRE